MEENLVRLLEQGISEIDSALEGDMLVRKLKRLYDEITLFNPSYGLVNASGRELVIKHILDCLAPVPLFRSFAGDSDVRMADLGSGSGLPGLVLSSAFPDWNVTLVERMGRRAGFLRNTSAMMGETKHISIVQKDLSEVCDQYDVITFRAFRQFKDIISDLDRILAPNGTIFAYKSSDENIQEELKVLECYEGCRFSCMTVDYSVPMLDAKRRMMVISRA